MRRLFAFVFCFFVCLSVFSTPASYSNDFVSHQWNSSDGLPGNTVTDIIQSHTGYIYIGTYEGLVRFDGFDFTVLNKAAGGKFKFVSARTVFEDSAGNLWIGSNDEGIQKISGDRSFIFSTANGLPNNSIRDIAEDRHGNIWIGTAGGVVYINPDNQICRIAYTGGDDVSGVLVDQLYCDTAGRIWLVSGVQHGIWYYNGRNFSRYTVLDGFGDYIPTFIGQDAGGKFWIGISQRGIVQIEEGEPFSIKTGTFVDSATVYSMYADISGIIWIGTDHGLVYYRDGKFFPFSEQDGSVSNTINKIIGDREGNVWVATDRDGVQKISPGKFRVTNLGTAVNAMAEDGNGRVWVGTDDGLRCFVREQEVSNALTEFCAGKRIRHVSVTRAGDILVSCYSEPGQVRWRRDGTLENWTAASGLAGNKTRVAVEISNGDVYVGTTTGLSIIRRDGSVTSYSRTEGFECDYVMCIFEDSQGIVWVGTDGGGIYLVKDGFIVGKLGSANGIAGNVVFKILEDESGAIWICTGTGVTKYIKPDQNLLGHGEGFLDVETEYEDEDSDHSSYMRYDFDCGKMFNFTSSQGIGTDSIFQILFDYTGTAWMTSNRGISAVPAADLNAVASGEKSRVDARFFNQNDGLRTAGVNSTSLSMCDSLGRIWFTLVDGFAVYDPVKVKSNVIEPLLHIESVRAGDSEIFPSDGIYEIPAGTKRIDIKYTGLSFVAPERIHFRYKLDGFEKGYSEPVQDRTVSYTNLKPGSYTFFLTAMNSDGISAEAPEAIRLLQKSFIWQLPVFWIGVVLMVFVTVIVIVYIVISESKKRQLLLETQVQLKTVDLEIERDKSERLLRSILPEKIADKLKEPGSKTVADSFDSVTIMFLDIVNFTSITSHSSPDEIVGALNNLFSRFDERASKMGVEKIKTIGDAYMAACGVPEPNPDHALVMIKFARGVYEDLAEYNRTAKIRFNIRIGLNSGPVIAGVIGKNKFIYDVWGDTVNVASRMESLCNPGEILVTDNVRNSVEDRSLVDFSVERQCDVKGKGLMRTFVISV